MRILAIASIAILATLAMSGGFTLADDMRTTLAQRHTIINAQ